MIMMTVEAREIADEVIELLFHLPESCPDLFDDRTECLRRTEPLSPLLFHSWNKRARFIKPCRQWVRETQILT